MSTTKGNRPERDDFLKAVSELNTKSTELSSFINRDRNKIDTFNIAETLQTLNKKQQISLWTDILSTTETVLKELEAAHEREGSPSLPALVDKLECIAYIVQSAVIKSTSVHPRLQEITTLLYSLLLSLPESYRQISDVISKICVYWWKSDLPNRQRLYPNLISYLLVKTQQSKGTTLQVIKEIYSVRKGLLDMDLSEEQCNFMKPFFLKLMSCGYQQLKIRECSQLLSFLFSIHPSFILDLHLAIIGIVSGADKKVIEIYGAIYFNAWRHSTGVCREKLENDCIQDLLYKCMLAVKPAIFNTIHLLLSKFFENKQLNGVDEMLYRILNPFIWRFLSCLNADVRLNTAAIFFDSFPIQDPAMSRKALDETIQKQFDLILELLVDEFAEVRAATVTNTLKVITRFWDFFPGHIKKSILAQIVTGLAFDANSVAVRTNVITGIGGMLSNQFTHQALQSLLPNLSNHIHDTSEQVRVATVDLLIKIKHCDADISFCDVVPVEHLLARIELESAGIVMKIVALLMSSFLPVEKPGEFQLTRVLSMLSSSGIVVSRKFYSYAHTYMTPAQTVSFISLIAVTLRKGIETLPNSENTSDSLANITNQSADVSESLEDLSLANPQSDTSSIQDPVLMQGLLEIIVCVWYSAIDTLTQTEHRAVYRKLIKTVSQCIPVFYNRFKEPEARSAVLLLAGLIPPEKIRVLSYNPLDSLSLYTPESLSEHYMPILMCIVRWHQGKDLMLVFLHSIECLFGKGKRKLKTGPKLSFEMALRLLESLFDNPPSLEQILCLEETQQLSRALSATTGSIETFIRRECDNTNLTVPILSAAFRVHCKLLALLSQPSDTASTENTVSSLDRLVACLNWARLLPQELALTVDITEIRVTSRRKRKNMQSPSEIQLILPGEMHNFILSLLSDIVPLTADLMLTGLRYLPAIEAACQLNIEVSRVKEFEQFSNDLSKFVYNIIASFDFEENITSFGDIWDFCCQILGSALRHIYEVSMTKSLPKQEISFLSQSIEIAVKHIDRLRTSGDEESIFDTSQVNVHTFIVALSTCINSILIESVQARLISMDLDRSQIELRPEVLPEFQQWLSKVVRKLNSLKLECIYQLEAMGPTQSSVQTQAVLLCKKLFSLEK